MVGQMKRLFRLVLILALAVSVYPVTASANRCTNEQMQKMVQGGLSQQEITHICDTSGLSLEKATEILKAYAEKNSDLKEWYRIPLPRPGNIQLHDLTWYYKVLKDEKYVTRWEEDRANPKEIKVDLTEKGKRFVKTGMSPEGKYSILCCYFEDIAVTCLTPDPAGDKASGEFQVSPSDLFNLLQYVATKYATNVAGEVEFRRVGEEWKVERVYIKTGIHW
jgi:hypothetical protein